jgi:hypothetical protein
MTGVILGGAIAALAVLLVALPWLLRSDGDDSLHAPTEAEERRLLLIEERDHALAALKELEFDHRTGKVDDTDYRALVGPLRKAAADALRALDAESPKEGRPPARAAAAPVEVPVVEVPVVEVPEVEKVPEPAEAHEAKE